MKIVHAAHHLCIKQSIAKHIVKEYRDLHGERNIRPLTEERLLQISSSCEFRNCGFCLAKKEALKSHKLKAKPTGKTMKALLVSVPSEINSSTNQERGPSTCFTNSSLSRSRRANPHIHLGKPSSSDVHLSECKYK